MGSTKTSTWVGGTVVLGLLILVLAWFVAIAPQVEAASSAREEAESTRQQNVVQANRLATLAAQFEQLDTFKAELAAIRTQIPTEGGMPGLLRELDEAEQATGLTIVSVVPGTPEAFMPAAPSVADAGATEGEEGESTDTGASQAAVVEGLVAVPVQVTVVGGYENAAGFVDHVQTELDRLFMVTSFQATGQDEAEASGGRPATEEGDVELVLNGFVYVLQESAAPAAGTEPGAEATEESGESTDV